MYWTWKRQYLVQVANKSVSSCWTCKPNLGSLEYFSLCNHLRYCISTSLVFNADTLITGLLYALFDLVQLMFWMERFLESPWKPLNLVFPSPGKTHMNVCTNPVTCMVSQGWFNQKNWTSFFWWRSLIVCKCSVCFLMCALDVTDIGLVFVC